MYNEHFGFAEAPFNVTPDPRFFFTNPCYDEAFSTLRYGIEQRKGFIVVTGEPGTGKTTLLKRLLGNLDRRVHTAWIFDPHLTFNELFRLTLTDLGLPVDPDADRLALLGQFYDYLIDQLKKGDIVALIIDEAQNLNEEILEELRLLSNLETNTEKLLQIVLAGQPELEQKLDQSSLLQLKQRIAARHRMRPLQENEIPAYLQTRLKTAQCERDDVFDAAAVRRLAAYSRGVPRLINVTCDNALLLAYAKERKSVTAEEIEEAARELKLADGPPTTAESPPMGTGRADPATPPPRREAEKLSARTAPGWREREFDSEWKDHRSELDRPFLVETRWRKPERPRHRMGGRILLCLAVAAAAFVAVQGEPALGPTMRSYVAKLSDWAHAPEPEPLPASVPDTQQPDHHDVVSQVAPAPESAPDPDPKNEAAPAPEPPAESKAENADRAPQVNGPAKKAPATADNKRMTIKRRSSPAPDGDALSERRLQIEIYKAIRDRAINGVQVSYVDDGTVYLEGRVATPRQKLAAVRATLSVPGVKGVRDRITIDY